jgi:periplasmic protein TonB
MIHLKIEQNSAGMRKMLKAIIFVYCTVQIPTTLYGQEKVILYYNSKWEITNKSNSTYYREAEYDLSTFKLEGKTIDHTLKGIVIMEGIYSNDKKNGSFTFFYENGNLKSRGKYENNKRIGYWLYYYPNNKMKQKIYFPQIGENRDISVIQYFDMDGKQLLKDGNGIWVNDSIEGGPFDTYSLKKLTGQFKDSLKVGKWNLVRISDNKLMLSDIFRKGKYISSTVFEPQFNAYGTMSFATLNQFPDEYKFKFQNTENFKVDTVVYSNSLINSDVETIFKTVTGKEYKIQQRNASYPLGDLSLLEFIGENIQYPASAFEKKINGKVYLSVSIDSLGKTKEVKILRGVQDDLNAEAVRVVKLINDWLPAIKNGKKVESIINIPVTFKIK